ncbi:hypothetical protein CSKR_109156 [Clonorchis sinensis]|uniref:Uncharacterized protein n=1 Tax=Clonorchis sinensis TaxID=79923 RepID=A0A419Q972_CLOSI|nr:hypothetical protein CSKR_109156 [Clonorchis sinensis]
MNNSQGLFHIPTTRNEKNCCLINVRSQLENLLTMSPSCVSWVNGGKPTGQTLFKQGLVVSEVIEDGLLENAFYHLARHAREANKPVASRRQSVTSFLYQCGNRFLSGREKVAFVVRLTKNQVKMLCQCERRFLQDPWMDLVWPRCTEGVSLVQELANVLLRRTDSRIHGLIHRSEAFAQVSRVGFVLVVQQLERQLLNDKNKTDPGNLGESLAPVYQSVNP